MILISKIGEMQERAIAAQQQGLRIAFVPTMGYLHDGHASLLREGKKRADVLILSVFVNPMQFGKNEDLDNYPRDMERDLRIAGECGVDIVFSPTAAEMYPDRFQTCISVTELSLPLCGASRPGHFDGVATVVAKLLNVVMPDVALFGTKDFQQLAIIRRMVADLNMRLEIVGMPIVREPDGLAMSSRNAYLSVDERRQALSLSRAIGRVRQMYRSGERSTAVLAKGARTVLEAAPAAVIDYLEFRDELTLQAVEWADDTTLMALAVKIGRTRLIDNMLLGSEL